MGSFFTSLCLLLILVVQNCYCNEILENLVARVESLEEEGVSKDKRIGVLESKIEFLTQSRVCEKITVEHLYSTSCRYSLIQKNGYTFATIANVYPFF
jgi:hypothetical protein